MALPDQLTLLCRAIGEKAKKEAEDILSRAREQSEHIVREAQNNIHRELEKQFTSKQQAVFQQARQLNDRTNMKARQQLLVAQEELLQKIFSAAREKLLNMREEENYSNILHSIALQAISQLPEDQCWIQVRASDKPFFSDEYCLSLSRSSKHKVNLLDEPADISGGCHVYSSDKKMLVDFSLESLLTRAKPQLRELLASEFLEGKN